MSDATIVKAAQGDGGKISIHAPRERCDVGYGASTYKATGISIHAPRERCDYQQAVDDINSDIISIHAPRERCDGK